MKNLLISIVNIMGKIMELLLLFILIIILVIDLLTNTNMISYVGESNIIRLILLFILTTYADKK